MPVSAVRPQVVNLPAHSQKLPCIVVGVTNQETRLILRGRLRALSEAGFRVALVSNPGELLSRTANNEKVESHPIPMQRPIAPIADVVSLYRMWQLLRRLKPDLTEFSTPKAGLLGTLAAKFCGVPRRVYILRGLKLETTTGIRRHVLLAAERLTAASAHFVLCNSESLRAGAMALGIAPAAKLLLLGAGSRRGVDMEKYSPGESDVRERCGIPADEHVVGYVGRLTRDKGLPELIDAFDAILQAEPKTHLLLVGWFDASEDVLGSQIRARIVNHPRIHLTGFVEGPAAFYRAMDVMVLPSWREGFPKRCARSRRNRDSSHHNILYGFP